MSEREHDRGEVRVHDRSGVAPASRQRHVEGAEKEMREALDKLADG